MELVYKCEICYSDDCLHPLKDFDRSITDYLFNNTVCNQDSLICKKCFEDIEMIFRFKKTCLDLKSQNNKYTNNNSERSLSDQEHKTNIICRICLNDIQNSEAMFDILKDDFGKMFPRCLPELNFELDSDPVSCDKCLSIIEQYFSIMQCLEVIKIKQETIFNDDLDQGEIEIKDEIKTEVDSSASLCQEDVDGTTTYRGSSFRDPLSTNDSKIFRCTYCNAYQSNKKCYLLKHIQGHKALAENITYKCFNCTYQTLNKENLKRHMLIHRPPERLKMYKCSECNYQARKNENLKRHIQTIHTILIPSTPVSDEWHLYKCSECDFQTEDKHYIKYQHIMALHKTADIITLHKCSECLYLTKKKSNLTHHMLSHQSVEDSIMYKCLQCDYQTKYKGYLKYVHMKIHEVTEEVTFQCPECPYVARKRKTFTNHLLTHKPAREIKIYECSYCSYKTKRKSDLRKHIHIHDPTVEVTMFKCSYCTYESKWRSALRNHLRTHKNVILTKVSPSTG